MGIERSRHFREHHLKEVSHLSQALIRIFIGEEIVSVELAIDQLRCFHSISETSLSIQVMSKELPILLCFLAVKGIALAASPIISSIHHFDIIIASDWC